ncbi:MAG: MBL fold metallo-hydrolase [Oscillospiraceae bacterium]|nr:MBL fold metallo-hydrolase [Oscillospiraceae bacterium]
MKIIALKPYGAFGTNSYIIHDETRAALIDAPGNNEAVLRALAENDLVLEKILLTHGHCDHIEGTAELSEKTGAEIYIHKDDYDKLNSPYLNLTEYFSLPPIKIIKGVVRTVKDGDIIPVGKSISVKVMHTPGHTRGSVMYIAQDHIFSGDTIFAGSVGRTDMPDGDGRVLAQSLGRIAAFEGEYPDYYIFAGHGGASKLFYEKQSNPYMGFAQF